MKIWQKLNLGFIVIIIVMIIINYISFRTDLAVIHNIKKLELNERVAHLHTSKIAYLIQNTQSNLNEIMIEFYKPEGSSLKVNALTKDVQKNLTLIDASLSKIEKTIAKSKNLLIDPIKIKNKIEKEAVKLEDLNTKISKLKTVANQILNLKNNHQVKEIELFFKNKVEYDITSIENLIHKLIEDVEFEEMLSIEQMELTVNDAIKVGITLTLLAILLSISISYFISKSISKPIELLIKSSDELRKGNMKTRVTLKNKDELKTLADSFNKMATELDSKINAINKLNNKLEQANQTKNTFFSIIAHDIKNPFSAVLGYANLLNQNFSDLDEDKKIKIINNLNDVAKLTFDLLNNLLVWAKSQTGSLKLNKENLNLNEVITESINLYTHNAENKNISLSNHISNNTTIYADKFTFNVIINNILNNAIKFTPTNGNILFSAIESENQVILSIKDSGVGMTKETIDSLLHSDSNIPTKGTNNEIGSGLGITLIKSFVKKNNGELFINSEIGKGTEIKISLPK
jgi:signal transduction histidine kinase